MANKLSDKSIMLLDLKTGNTLEIPFSKLLSQQQFLQVWKSVTGTI
jgi:hypothetical protein